MARFTLALALTFTAAAAFAHDFDGTDCSSSHYQFDGRGSVTKQEVIEAGPLASLKAVVRNSPLSLAGGNSGGYTITVCKAAATQADLDAIRVTLENGELRATGPDDGRWTAAFRIQAPLGARVELEAANGPISVRDFDGALTAHAQNGPLSLKNVSGEVDASTSNGPISVSGSSGTMKLAASNGPLTVGLDGTGWVGGGLEATTKNGPLTLKIPRGYGSGVVVEKRGSGPISCRAEGCGRVADLDARDWSNEPQTVELGSGPAAVRLSTVNGPVTIKERE